MNADEKQRVMRHAGFRKGSKAEKVALDLLDGKPHSRMDLASRFDVSDSTVNRAASMLEAEGIEFLRLAKGREVVLQMIEKDDPAADGTARRTERVASAIVSGGKGGRRFVRVSPDEYRFESEDGETTEIRFEDDRLVIRHAGAVEFE